MYWDKASVSVPEDHGTLTITLRRDLPAEGEDTGAVGLTQEAVTVTLTDGKLNIR